MIKTLKKTIEVPGREYDELTELLKLNGPAEKAGRDEILGCFTAEFDDGLEVDVKVVNSDGGPGEGGPWSEAVLFQDGSEIACSEVCDTLGGEWRFQIHRDEHETEFVVTVVRE